MFHRVTSPATTNKIPLLSALASHKELGLKSVCGGRGFASRSTNDVHLERDVGGAYFPT